MTRLCPTIKALAATPLFHHLPKHELDTVQRLGTVIDIGPGRLVCRPDQCSQQFVVVVSGEIAATTARGRRTLHAGDWFGTTAEWWESLMEPESLETTTAATLLVVSRHDVIVLRFACPRLAKRLSGSRDVTREIDLTADAVADASPARV